MANTRKTLAAAVVAALPLLSVGISAPAQAQNHPRAAAIAPRIEAFNVDEVRRRLDLQLHEIQQVGAAGNEARAGRACSRGHCLLGRGRTFVAEGLHACTPPTSLIASMMLL